jgi:hypothetical protein
VDQPQKGGSGEVPIDKVPNLTDPNYDNLLFHQNMLQFSESVVLFSAGIGGKAVISTIG